MNTNAPSSELTQGLSLKDQIGSLSESDRHLILTRGLNRTNPTHQEVAPILRENNIRLGGKDMLSDEDVSLGWLEWYKKGVDMKFVRNLALSQNDMNVLMYPAWINTKGKSHPISERKDFYQNFLNSKRSLELFYLSYIKGFR